MLDVTYGAFHELEAAFSDRIRELKKDPLAPVLVVAPSRRLAERLQRLLAVERGLALVAVEFETFHSLAFRVAVAAGSLDRPVLSDSLFLDKLVDRLMEERRDPVRGRWRGLSPAVRASIKDLADAGVDARSALEQLDEGLFGGDTDELRRLLQLYAAFDERLASLGLVPPSELVRRAAEAAPDSRELSRYRAILYYGFYDLTGRQADFFESVAKAHPCELFYPYRRKDPAYAFADRFFESRLHIGRSPEPAPPVERPRKRLEVFHASGASDELWKAAKLILRLVEEEGFRFSDIGVVARILEPYRPFLRSVFDENEIPFTSTAEEPLLRHPAAKHALSLLTWAERDYPAVAMLDVFGSPHYRGGREAWKKLIERLRIHEGWLQWEGKLSSWAASGEDEVVPRVEAAGLLAELRRLKADLESWGEKPGWGAASAHARGVLERYLDLSEEAAPVREAIESVFERLAGFEPLGAPTREEFLEALEEAFRRSTLELAPGATLGVRVLDAMAARGESFRALIVLGLKEKLFPRLIREDPFLRDRHRAALRDHAGWWISTKLGGYDEEKLLFRLLVDSASERLIAAYPRADEQGRAQTPSIYLLELMRAEGVSPQAVPLRPAPKLESESARLSPKEASLALALRGADPSGLYQALGWPLGDWREGERAAAAVAAFGAAGAFDGVTGPSAVIERRLARGLAVTAVQEFAVCPFRFFASRVLEVDAPEEARERKAVGADVRGEIYHRFLERYYRSLGGGAGFDAAAERLFAATAEATFAEFGWRSLGVYPLLWRSLREEMEGHLRAFVRRDLESRRPGEEPAEFELELEGRIPGVDIVFRGRADRIDAGSEGFRVIDYKTSLSGTRLQTMLMQSRALQLAFYLELAGPVVGAKPAGAALVGIESDGEASIGGAEWSAIRASVLDAVGRHVEQMRRGEFFIYPSAQGRGYCSWCAYASACRRSHGPTLARSRRAESWAAFASAVTGKPVAKAAA